MKQHDVPGQSLPLPLCLIQNPPHRIQRFRVGKMPPAPHDPPLQKPRPVAAQLHLRIVVALDRQQIQTAESPHQFFTDAAQIRRVSDPPAESIYDKTMRAQLIMLEPDRVQRKTICRGKGRPLKGRISPANFGSPPPKLANSSIRFSWQKTGISCRTICPIQFGLK